ncbi:MAG: ABC transporter ATP-binding protein/permease [Methylococcaceae bacterium]|nr:ABC transporter ATP-binding protein/permease [Methylococcaceae bacterium]
MITSPNPPIPLGGRPTAKLEANIPNFFIQFVCLAGQFWHSENKRDIRSRTLALVGLTVLQIVIAVSITEWSSGLFNALEQHSMPKLMIQVWLVVLILIANVTVTYFHLKIKRDIMLEWRVWLTNRLIGQWMDDGHHYQITHLPGKHDNPDGRIAEDIRIATEFAIELAHSLLYAVLLLVSFTKILWTLSGTLDLSLGVSNILIPGYLVWLALAYAAIASTLGWKIGQPLTLATHTRQAEEANFRFGLVRARENSEAIALVHGETDERRRFSSLFGGIVEAWNRQTRAFANILMFTSGYSVISMALPILAASPRYIAGVITLGALVQSAQAFQQMVGALSFPVDNLAKMAEWRASVERVLGLTKALDHLEEDIAQTDSTPIVVEVSQRSALVFHDVSIANPDNDLVILDKFNAEIKPGERVFLSGDPAVGSKLFKVIAGLWPWGDGKVDLPAEDRMFFMPPRPYLPIETLRGAVSYPAPPDTFDAAEVERALRRVGLEELISRLEEIDTWENCLVREQLQRLGIARMLLHRPRWILLQEALDSLAAEDAEQMMAIVCEELPDAAILTVTNQSAIAAFHQRQISIQCPECEMNLKKEIRRRRDQESLTSMGALLGALRKDRRKN